MKDFRVDFFCFLRKIAVLSDEGKEEKYAEKTHKSQMRNLQLQQ